MKLSSGEVKPRLMAIGGVIFGSTIRLHETPSTWSSYMHFVPITRKTFMLSSEYYRSEKDDDYDARKMLLIDLDTGAGYPINPSAKVEVISKRGELMKIVDGPCVPSVNLEDICIGRSLRFVNNLHSKHEIGDVFLRVSSCSGYVPEKLRREAKIQVANLRTGEVAWVCKKREVIPVKAEVCVTAC